ncbi:MAG: hypothetical protein HY537_18445 [Deltaproteobacteria bacterium]|nr:hypothetical protein [Deltaproteobacteria bacterium]
MESFQLLPGPEKWLPVFEVGRDQKEWPGHRGRVPFYNFRIRVIPDTRTVVMIDRNSGIIEIRLTKNILEQSLVFLFSSKHCEEYGVFPLSHWSSEPLMRAAVD